MGMHQGLDLSRFKKVSSDKQTTTLKHAKGHEIRLAHGGLTPKMRASLDALPMAEGGDVDPDQTEMESAPIQDMDPSSPEPVQDSPDGADDMKQALAEANTGAADNPVTPISYTPEEPEAAMPEAPAPTPTMQQLGAEDQAWANDLKNGHITPETYQGLFAKKDTLGKIGTLFGLLVSGAGSGLSHQPNAVMDMMNRELQNDLHAQIQSKNNRNTYMNANIGALQGITNADNVASHTALNNMRNASYQHLWNLNDKAPTQIQQTGAQILQAMMPGIQAANMQGNAKAVLASHQAKDGQTTFAGPVNNEALSALSVLSPEFGGPAAAEADRVTATRKQWDAYRDAFSKLNTVTAGQTGENLAIAGKALEGITSSIPVAALAGKVAGSAGSLVSRFQQYRNAVRAQVGADFPEEFLPSLHDTPGDRSQKLRSAATWAKQREGRTPTLDLLQARGMNVVAPSPYDAVLVPHGTKGNGKPSSKKNAEPPNKYQGLVDALKTKEKPKVAK